MQRIHVDRRELTDLAARTRDEVVRLRAVRTRLRRAAAAVSAPPPPALLAAHESLVAGIAAEIRRLEDLGASLERRARGVAGLDDDVPAWALRLAPPSRPGLHLADAARLRQPEPASHAPTDTSPPAGPPRVLPAVGVGATLTAPLAATAASGAVPTLPAAPAPHALHPLTAGFARTTTRPATGSFLALTTGASTCTS